MCGHSSKGSSQHHLIVKINGISVKHNGKIITGAGVRPPPFDNKFLPFHAVSEGNWAYFSIWVMLSHLDNPGSAIESAAISVSSARPTLSVQILSPPWGNHGSANDCQGSSLTPDDLQL